MTHDELTIRPAVQKWEWDRGKPTATHGADLLHDLADQLETGGTGQQVHQLETTERQ